MVAGGGVLAWMGFSMLKGRSAAGDSKSKRSLTPLILFAASPGTITGVITVSVAHSRMTLPFTSLIAIAVATGITWLAMLLVAHFGANRRAVVLCATRSPASWDFLSFPSGINLP